MIDSRIARQLLVRRAVANGLNYEELDVALFQTKSLSDVRLSLFEVAEDLYARAVYWDELGLKPKASDHYLESALWSFYSQFLYLDEIAARFKVYSRCADSYRRAAPHFKHRAERVDIPYQASSLTGYLRLPQFDEDFDTKAECEPATPGRLPCVVILNAFNSSKEELHFTENAFLNQGMATFSFDYPGMGECVDLPVESLSDEHLGNSIYLYLASRNEIDATRTALLGISLGGTLALRMALIFPGRYRCLSTLSAVHHPKSGAPHPIPGVTTNVTKLVAGTSDIVREFSHRLSVGELAADVTCPILVAGGGRDPVALPEETKHIYDSVSSTDKKLLLCPRASHNMYEMMPSLRHEIAQWISQRI